MGWKSKIQPVIIRRNAWELIIQIIPVMIGVYLGFIVSDWSQQEQQTTKKKVLVESIIAEIQDNRSSIEAVVEYHETLRDTSRHYVRNDHSSMPSFFKGINTVTLRNSAFETGVQTGLLNELQVDKIQELNAVYASQNAYNEFCNILLSGLVNMDFSDKEASVQRILQYLSLTMTDVAIKERKLLREYEAVLKSIEDER